jgi:hypothetical protein
MRGNGIPSYPRFTIEPAFNGPALAIVPGRTVDISQPGISAAF